MYRWHLACNFLVLRIISFNLDQHWATNKYNDINNNKCNIIKSDDDKVSSISKVNNYDDDNDYDRRVEFHQPLYEYSYLNFMSYCLYCPLYVAGPILPYNAYISYCQKPLVNKYIGN
jgi:D-alanyl-lipoteichoic acid acyltransferase DltB (MBOAT superfamily)